MKTKELVKLLKHNHPYPEDIFLPRSKEDWQKFHRVLKDAGIESGGFVGHCCRVGYEACINHIETFTDHISN